MPRGAAPGERRGGRKKGTPNKTTTDLRADLMEVYNKLGGVQGMFEWALKDDANSKMFYSQIMPKLLPREIKAEVDQTTRQIFDMDTLKKMAKEFSKK